MSPGRESGYNDVLASRRGGGEVIVRAFRRRAGVFLVLVSAFYLVACASSGALAKKGSADGGEGKISDRDAGSGPEKPVTVPSGETAPASTVKDGVGAEKVSEAVTGLLKSDDKGSLPADDGFVEAEPSAPAPKLGTDKSTASSAPAARAAPAESGLRAGFSDDNAQFNYYLKFLDDYGRKVDNYPLRIAERIVIKVEDAEGRPVLGADVTVSANGKQLASGKTYASGEFMLYPLEMGEASVYRLSVSYAGRKAEAEVARQGPRTVVVSLSGRRSPPSPMPLDLLFILDTTGSMGEEIHRLRDTIEIIKANVSAVKPEPLVRFGLVLYRDQGDIYVTKRVPMTTDLEAFQRQLAKVEADGGGDNPEDLQSALQEALRGTDWNETGIRLAFVITDAPPHLDYGQSYTYAEAAREAKQRGIKIHSVGTGGLPLAGEYILRQLAQYSHGRYIFLTYGERGESEGGVEASVSHHSGDNYQTDKLEAIIIRFAREELALQSDAPLVETNDYFDARKVRGEDRDETLQKLFTQTLRSLADYSTYKVGPKTLAAIAPIGLTEADQAALSTQAEYFSEAALLAASQAKVFTLVERKDLQKILEEQELQYSSLVDEATAAKLGALLGAEVMVTGQLYARADAYEIFWKLLRVQTGEVLSVAKARVAKELGL